MSDHEELNNLLELTVGDSVEVKTPSNISLDDDDDDDPVKNQKKNLSAFMQWTTQDGKRFMPAGSTVDVIPPGLYDINVDSRIGIYFERLEIKTEGLLNFPHTNSAAVVREIASFWNKKAIFDEHGIVHKRGIMLYGPPGSGKSCTIQLVVQDVVNRGGLAVKFRHPGLFIEGMRLIRTIHKAMPVVVLMEDIDSIIQHYSESEVLNILDGIESIDRVVFLASTNYPEMLGARIINRPSRFDKRFKVGHPSDASREMYFNHLKGNRDIPELDVPTWVADTEGFSIAHMKELFVAVVILGDDYKEAVDTLRSMKENISSEHERTMGFGAGRRLLGTTKEASRYAFLPTPAIEGPASA